MTGTDTAPTIETVFRIEAARIIAGVTRVVRDIGIAEELAQDALVAALEQWPRSGVPDKPGAWLMATAKHRAIDLVRRKETYARKLAEVGRTLEDVPPPPEPGDPEDIDDDLLRLIFTSCHPVLSTQARIALTLRLLGGLTTEEIARAYLSSEPTVAQRIVRAKRTLAKAGVPFEVPYGEDRGARLSSVLEVIYLIFNEGYSATSGENLVRPVLCEDALRLARVLQGLMPDEPEVHGLAALLEFQGSRLPTRTGPDGELVLLADQDRSKWDRLLIRRGMAALRRAGVGEYSLQAAIAACHARANRYADTDWTMIASLYERLMALTPSPVVELNRAVAVAMAYGPQAGLEIVDALAELGSLSDYHLLPSVRGDLLERLGRTAEARAEFERAAALTGNARERDLLLARAERIRKLPLPPMFVLSPLPNRFRRRRFEVQPRC
ncbi:RNA polymerase sigma factor [Stackebrandtia nassauensis]|uniref:Putative RNA polymerase, sigma-24 subunit, ECF subfamily n=1 Tax=Stackebrandtia nassauensis (strain DSM 44728 / CIP 108903 / NRRL B-16338 / NBRC 102104 / LLR-40K-21) TaxID=446470 RepID=D3PY45_STANL|nr:RNA polymerase sigma factor [Stackebrandtia nassauensis]ADD45374.1 putative RNA polymerase, sigma-24 subunit, ECF subfamily [Stackebrandtia nassauensis DSM 44728]